MKTRLYSLIRFTTKILNKLTGTKFGEINNHVLQNNIFKNRKANENESKANKVLFVSFDCLKFSKGIIFFFLSIRGYAYL